MSLNDHLVDDVRSRVARLDEDRCLEWGGEWIDGEATVTNVAGEKYRERTVVRSVDDAIAAFAKYGDYFDHVLETFDPEHDNAVLLPCGANKPIGSSSIHQRKLDALEHSRYTEECDILILSEPCTIVPHHERLTLAATNYDFPPEFTNASTAPKVHRIFARRVAEFLDATEYDTIYAYLPEGHFRVFESALEHVESESRIVRIPGASFNPSTGAFCGDLMQSAEVIAAKLFYAGRFGEAI